MVALRTLERKLLVDLRRLWGQSVAISLVLACGVATFVMSVSTLRSLEATRDRYYHDYRFADVFVHLKRAPAGLRGRLAEIPGVVGVSTRVVEPVLLDIPGMIEPATARLISSADDPSGDLNRTHLRRGRFPEPTRPDEIVVAENFAEAHGLEPGDSVAAILNGKRRRLRVVGVGLSPEFIYAVPPGQLLPDDRRYGIFWAANRQIAAGFDMEGAFNDASLLLASDASVDDVVFRVDRLLDAYGGLGAYGREDQESHRRVADEMLQMRSMALVAPLIFLSVTAFLFHIVLSRMIDGQRDEIAMLRAFGYTAGEIGRHYLKFVVILLVPGILLGTLVGAGLARNLATTYGRFFRFPLLEFHLTWDAVGVAAAMALAAGVLGAFGAVLKAIRLVPAEAMRPQAPETFRETWTDRLGIWNRLPPIGLMVVRRLRRNFRPALLSMLGIALGEGVLVLGLFVEDTVEYVLDVQFSQSQRQDVMLSFREPLSARAFHDTEHLPGVRQAEPFRAVPVRLSNGRFSHRGAILGLAERPQLFRVLDEADRPVEIAGEGLTVSRKMAELLDVRPGDEVLVEVLEARRVRRTVLVTTVFPNYTEPAAYMRRAALHRLLEEGEQVSGAFVTVDERLADRFHRFVKETPKITGLSDKQAAIDSFRRTFAENLLRMRAVNLVFAFIICFGVIYNCARITLAERSRELATMRVLGFTRRETSAVLLGELFCITLAALPVGLAVGYGLSYATTSALDTETHRFPLVIDRETYAFAATVVSAAAAFSAAVVRRMIDRVDLIAVLKAKE
jgi:putative ABC transport system permease protein